MAKITYSIAVHKPFRFDLTALIMRRRSNNKVSLWDGKRYKRVLVIGDTPVLITVSQSGTQNNPRLVMTLESEHDLSFDQQVEAQLTVQKMFGLTVDVASFSIQVAQDPVMWNMAGHFLGAKPTRFPTIFEAIVTAITCQNATLDAGIDLLNKLTLTYGLMYKNGDEVMNAFPRPEDLAHVTEIDLKNLGYGARKAHAILSLTSAIEKGSLKLEQLELMNNEEAFAYLRKLPGLGRWATEYVMVRGLGRLDVFPADDQLAAGYLWQMLKLKRKPEYDDVKLLATTWHPYEGFVYLHLLLEWLRNGGLVK